MEKGMRKRLGIEQILTNIADYQFVTGHIAVESSG